MKPSDVPLWTIADWLCDGPTIDNWITVLFQRRHIEAIRDRLASKGHQLLAPDYRLGERPMDRFADLPPWRYDDPNGFAGELGSEAHLKLAIDGFVCTSFGIIVRKAV